MEREKFELTITKTHYSYGYNAKHRHYRIDSKYFTATVKHIAHKGYDNIHLTRKDDTHDSVNAMNSFFKEFYNGNLEKHFGVKEGESVTVEINKHIY